MGSLQNRIMVKNFYTYLVFYHPSTLQSFGTNDKSHVPSVRVRYTAHFDLGASQGLGVVRARAHLVRAAEMIREHGENTTSPVLPLQLLPERRVTNG